MLTFKVGSWRHGFFRDFSEQGKRWPKTGVLEAKNGLILDRSEKHVVPTYAAAATKERLKLGNTFRRLYCTGYAINVLTTFMLRCVEVYIKCVSCVEPQGPLQPLGVLRSTATTHRQKYIHQIDLWIQQYVVQRGYFKVCVQEVGARCRRYDLSIVQAARVGKRCACT